MSTPNFYYNNVLYAIETDESGWDEWSYDDLIDNILHELQADKFLERRRISYEPDHERNENRSYPGRMVVEYGIDENKHGVSASITVVIRSGYYTGINLDYNIEYTDEYGNLISENGDYIGEDSYLTNMGKVKEGVIEKIVTKIEKVFSMYSTKLNHLGTFSNGEAIYEEAKTLSDEKEPNTEKGGY